jgi:predicted DCC family thiol-disulfide oxidoreductase YuxK
MIVDYDQPTERLLSKSQAVLFTLQTIGGLWGVLAALRMIPKSIRDVGYDLVAHNRYRLFGKYETCLMPDEKYRHKFIDL